MLQTTGRGVFSQALPPWEMTGWLISQAPPARWTAGLLISQTWPPSCKGHSVGLPYCCAGFDEAAQDYLPLGAQLWSLKCPWECCFPMQAGLQGTTVVQGSCHGNVAGPACDVAEGALHAKMEAEERHVNCPEFYGMLTAAPGTPGESGIRSRCSRMRRVHPDGEDT